MEICLAQEVSQKQICLICDCPISDHAPECEYAQITIMQERNTYINCPKCTKGQIGINSLDLYECRSCHAQFSSGVPAEAEEIHKFKMLQLIDFKNDRFITVWMLPEKGEGNFPFDASIEMLQEMIVQKQAAL